MADSNTFGLVPSRPQPDLPPLDLAQQAFAAVDRQRRLIGWETTQRLFAVSGAGDRLLQQIVKKRNKPGESTDATIVWGQASNFDILQDIMPGLQLLGGTPSPGTPDPAAGQTLTFTETARTTTDVRVENPSDSSQFVIVRRIETITFLGEDHLYRKFILNGWT